MSLVRRAGQEVTKPLNNLRLCRSIHITLAVSIHNAHANKARRIM